MQLSKILGKFSKFLFPVFASLASSPALASLVTLVHGDAKLDNFLFRKETTQLEEIYQAMLIDWQVVHPSAQDNYYNSALLPIEYYNSSMKTVGRAADLSL